MVDLYAEVSETIGDRGSRTRGGLKGICNNQELCNYVCCMYSVDQKSAYFDFQNTSRVQWHALIEGS